MARLTLEVGTERESVQGNRLPIARKSNLEKGDAYSHFQDQQGNRLLRVENSSQGIRTWHQQKPVNGSSLEPIETTKRLFSPFERSEMPSTRASQPSSPRSLVEHPAEVPSPTLAAAVQEVLQTSHLLQLDGAITSRKLSSELSNSCTGERDVYESPQEVDIAEDYLKYDTARPSLLIQSPENIEIAKPILDSESEFSSQMEPSFGISRSSGRQKPNTRIPALRAEITEPKTQLKPQPEPADLISSSIPVSLGVDRDIPPILPESQMPSLVLPPAEEAKSVGKSSPEKGSKVQIGEKSAKNSPRSYLKKGTFKGEKGKAEKKDVHKQVEGQITEQSTEKTAKAKEKQGNSRKKSVGKSTGSELDKEAKSPNPAKATFSQAATESITAPNSRKNSHGSESPRTPRTPKLTSNPTAALQSSPTAAQAIPEQSDESKHSSSQSSEIDQYDGDFLSTFHPSNHNPKPSRKRKMTLPIEVAAKISAEIGKEASSSPYAQLRRASIAFDHTSQLKSVAKERRKRKQHRAAEGSQERKAEGGIDPVQLIEGQIVSRFPTSPRARVVTRPNGKLYIRTRIVDFASVGAADPFDLFLKELAHSLLYMIEDIIDEEIAGQSLSSSEAKHDSALMHFLRNTQQGNGSMLSLLRQSKPSASVPTSPKGMAAQDYAKRLLQKITTGSKKETKTGSISSLSDLDEDFSDSEDEHELHKLQRQRDKMADYELKHLSMLKKIAEDLIKGSEATESIDQMAIPSLPIPVEPEKSWAAWEGQEADFSFVSEGTELGGKVSDLLKSMLAGSNQAEFTAFMASPAGVLQHSVAEKETGFPDTDPDMDNYHSDLLRRHFKAICSALGPDYEAAVEEWRASLFQIEPQQLLPIELMQLLRGAYLKKKHRLKVFKHRAGQEFVHLRAKPTSTFSNLHPSRLSEPPQATALSPLKRPMTERSFSERVYLRMKRNCPYSDFFKPKSRPNATVLSEVSEEL